MTKWINRLSDITEWDVNGNWTAWSLPSLIDRNLANCSVHKNMFFEKLTGLAPIHHDCKDTWGWGINGSYSIAIGFNQLYSAQPGSPCTHNRALWKMVWNMPSVPKITFFIWTIMHQKILIGENLIKRGFFGPYRCCFCQQSDESTAHILVECIFAQKVWVVVLRGLPISFFPLSAELVTLFKNWQSRYPGTLSSSHVWRKIWKAITKFIWWKIWLARNDLVFNNKILKSEIVA